MTEEIMEERIEELSLLSALEKIVPAELIDQSEDSEINILRAASSYIKLLEKLILLEQEVI